MNTKLQFGPIIHATDPCYTRGTWCATWNINIKPGLYNYKVEYSDEGKWGERVKSLAIFHENYTISDSGWKLNEKAEIGIDSGQAGFFDDSIYPLDEKSTGDYDDENSFYSKCCNATSDEEIALAKMNYRMDLKDIEHYLNFYGEKSEEYLNAVKQASKKPEKEDPQFGIIYDGRGIVSRTGFGDGGYPLYYKENSKKEIIALKIKYI